MAYRETCYIDGSPASVGRHDALIVVVKRHEHISARFVPDAKDDKIFVFSRYSFMFTGELHNHPSISFEGTVFSSRTVCRDSIV